MNKQQAYDLCSEITLLNKEYVARENAHTTYILVQISDLPETVAISGMIIDPTLPETGSHHSLLKLPLQQRIAVLSLKRMTEQVSKTHRELDNIADLASNKETWKEAAELLDRLIKRTLTKDEKQ